MAPISQKSGKARFSSEASVSRGLLNDKMDKRSVILTQIGNVGRFLGCSECHRIEKTVENILSIYHLRKTHPELAWFVLVMVDGGEKMLQAKKILKLDVRPAREDEVFERLGHGFILVAIVLCCIAGGVAIILMII